MLASIQAEHARLEALLSSIDETTLDRPGVVGNWSIIEGLSDNELTREEVYEDLTGNIFAYTQDHRQTITAALGLDTANQP